MTNQAFDFSNPYSPSGVNIYGSAITTSAGDEFQRQTWRQLVSPDPKKYRIMECTVWDLRNGYQPRGGSIGTETSTLDQRFGLILGQKARDDTVATGNNGTFVTSCHFGPTPLFVMGIGSNGNGALLTPAGALSPLIDAVAYSPGSTITNVRPIIQGGATAAERLAICQTANTIEILTDLTPTSAGSMNAALTACYGFTSSPAPSGGSVGSLTHLIPANGTMYTLASTAAIGAAPTAVLTGIPIGVMPIDRGIEQLQKNIPLRAWWFWPPQSSSTLLSGAGQLVKSTTIEGQYPEDLPLNIGRVNGGVMWNRTLALHNGHSIVAYDGENERNLHFQKNRPPSSAFRWGTNGIYNVKGDLYSLTVKSDVTSGVLAGGGGVAGASVMTVERFTPEFDAWTPASGTFTLQTGDAAGSSKADGPGIQYMAYNTSVPYDQTSGYAQVVYPNNNDVTAMFMPAPGVDPYRTYNATGATSFYSSLPSYASSGVFTSNEFFIPGAGHNPTVLYEIDASGMDVATGGTGSQVEVEWATESSTGATYSFSNNLSAIFKPSDPQAKLYKFFGQNTSTFKHGKFRITATGNSTDNGTGEYLPVTFRMITYLEGKVDKTPVAVLSGAK